MEPENPGFVEEYNLPGCQTVRVHVSFREGVWRVDRWRITTGNSGSTHLPYMVKPSTSNPKQGSKAPFCRCAAFQKVSMPKARSLRNHCQPTLLLQIHHFHWPPTTKAQPPRRKRITSLWLLSPAKRPNKKPSSSDHSMSFLPCRMVLRPSSDRRPPGVHRTTSCESRAARPAPPVAPAEASAWHAEEPRRVARRIAQPGVAGLAEPHARQSREHPAQWVEAGGRAQLWCGVGGVGWVGGFWCFWCVWWMEKIGHTGWTCDVAKIFRRSVLSLAASHPPNFVAT